MLKKQFYILFLILILIFTACTSVDNGEIKENEEVTYEISNEDMLIEYDYIWDLLDENYPYFEFIEKRGIDIDKLKSEYREKIENAKNFDEYLFTLNTLFNDEIKKEGHLNIAKPEIFFVYNKNFSTYEKKEGEDIHYEYQLKYYLNDKAKTRYEMLRDKGITLQEETSEGPSLEVIKKGDTLIFDYNRFIGNIDLNLDRMAIEEALTETSYENVIIDIRGNSGGFPVAWHQMVGMFLTEDVITEEYYLCKGEMSNKYYKYLEATGQGPEFVQEIDEDLNIFKVKESLLSEKVMSYIPNIYLLIDENTKSAALMFSTFAKEEGFATILGNSPVIGGDGGWTSAHSLYPVKLPKSHIIINWYTNVRCDEEGNKIDPIVEPDYIIDKDENYDNIIEMINSL